MNLILFCNDMNKMAPRALEHALSVSLFLPPSFLPFTLRAAASRCGAPTFYFFLFSKRRATTALHATCIAQHASPNTTCATLTTQHALPSQEQRAKRQARQGERSELCDDELKKKKREGEVTLLGSSVPQSCDFKSCGLLTGKLLNP